MLFKAKAGLEHMPSRPALSFPGSLSQTSRAKPGETYTQFRPVHFGFKTLRYDCTKSDFWFEKKP